jgi:hypothetical protein
VTIPNCETAVSGVRVNARKNFTLLAVEIGLQYVTVTGWHAKTAPTCNCPNLSSERKYA